MTSSQNSRALFIILIGGGFLLLGIAFDYLPMTVDTYLKKTTELATNEMILSFWTKPPITIPSYYWLYNITNPDEFMSGEKARVERVGPFHFTYRMEKRIIELSKNKYRITYNQTRIYSLNSSTVGANFDAPMVGLNAILPSVIGAVSERSRGMEQQQAAVFVTTAVRLAEKFNETLLRNTTAREILVGRKSVFLDRMGKLAATMGEDLGDRFPKNGVFGLIASQNGTLTGPMEVYTGYGETSSLLGNVIAFQAKQRSAHYSGPCGRIQSSAGELRPIPLDFNQSLELFRPEVGRVLHLRPTGVQKMREGLGICYVFDEMDFSSPLASNDPKRTCYCVNRTNDNYCSLNGVIEMGPVQSFAPLIFSLNTLEPDRRIRDSIANWEPDLINSHVDSIADGNKSCQLVILKMLGIPIQVEMTAILYVKVERNNFSKLMKNIPEVSYLPLVMQRELVRVPDDFLAPLVHLNTVLGLSRHLKVVFYVSSMFLLVPLTNLYYRQASSGGDAGAAGHRNAEPDEDEQPANNMENSNNSGAKGNERDNNNNNNNDKTRPTSVNAESSSVPLEIGNQTAPTTDIGAQGRDAKKLSCLQKDALKHNSFVVPVNIGNLTPEEPAKRNQPQKNFQQNSSTRKSSIPQTNSGLLFGASVKKDSFGANAGMLLNTNKGPAGVAGLHAKASDGSLKLDLSRSPSIGASSKPGNSSEEPVTRDGAAASDNQDPRAPASTSTMRRKNWLVKVYTDVVRVFNDIKRSISTAGQLDISENDFHDKQLEMLAGRISSWYEQNGTGEPPATTAPASDRAAAAPLGETPSTREPTADREATQSSELSAGGVKSDEGQAAEQAAQVSSRVASAGSSLIRDADSPSLEANQEQESQTSITTTKRNLVNVEKPGLETRAVSSRNPHMTDCETQTDQQPVEMATRSEDLTAVDERKSARSAQSKMGAERQQADGSGGAGETSAEDEDETRSFGGASKSFNGETGSAMGLSGDADVSLAAEDKEAALMELEKTIETLEQSGPLEPADGGSGPRAARTGGSEALTSEVPGESKKNPKRLDREPSRPEGEKKVTYLERTIQAGVRNDDDLNQDQATQLNSSSQNYDRESAGELPDIDDATTNNNQLINTTTPTTTTTNEPRSPDEEPRDEDVEPDERIPTESMPTDEQEGVREQPGEDSDRKEHEEVGLEKQGEREEVELSSRGDGSSTMILNNNQTKCSTNENESGSEPQTEIGMDNKADNKNNKQTIGHRKQLGPPKISSAVNSIETTRGDDGLTIHSNGIHSPATTTTKPGTTPTRASRHPQSRAMARSRNGSSEARKLVPIGRPGNENNHNNNNNNSNNNNNNANPHNNNNNNNHHHSSTKLHNNHIQLHQNYDINNKPQQQQTNGIKLENLPNELALG